MLFLSFQSRPSTLFVLFLWQKSIAAILLLLLVVVQVPSSVSSISDIRMRRFADLSSAAGSSSSSMMRLQSPRYISLLRNPPLGGSNTSRRSTAGVLSSSAFASPSTITLNYHHDTFKRRRVKSTARNKYYHPPMPSTTTSLITEQQNRFHKQQQRQQHYFSSLAMPPLSPLFATIPTTDESYDDSSLDFADLDIFKNQNGDDSHEEEEEKELQYQIDNDHSAEMMGGGESSHDDLVVNGNGKSSDAVVTEENMKMNGSSNNNNNKQNNNKQKKQDMDNSNVTELIIKSKPKEGGMWNPSNPLGWCQSFGSRSPKDTQRLASLTQLRPGDDGYHNVNDCTVPDVTIVRTKEQAQIVLSKLMQDKLDNPWRIHACDTEVMDIDLKLVGPVGHGYVTCLSVYSGPDFDYGLGGEGGAEGEQQKKGTMLWVDNLDDAHGLLYEFQSWLEDETILKVWHNYGFDRHVLYNEGINVKGFGGDTMHMARLSDTSRMKYSLESLTEDLLGQRKVPMKEIFGEARLRKDGTPGALIDLPPMERLQREPKYRQNWIKYSAFDAKSTYNLYRHLENKLEKTSWFKTYSLMDYYREHMRPFGEVLTDLERRGILVATDYLADVEVQARKDREGHVKTFKEWAASQVGPDGLAMNLASSVQLSTFLFGGTENIKTKERSESTRVFKTPRADIPDDAMEAYRERDARMKEDKTNNPAASVTSEGEAEIEDDEFDLMKATELKVLCKEYGLKVSGKKAELQQRLRGHFQMMNNPPESSNVMSANVDDYDSMSVKDLRDACNARGVPSKGTKAALIKELRADDSMIREVTAEHMKTPSNGDDSIVYRKMSELLEEAVSSGGNDALKTILADIKAKNEEEPKYVDVKITSLGMTPDKFTTSGAPSATADVLRNLAGDPFADPPKYGTVRLYIC